MNKEKQNKKNVFRKVQCFCIKKLFIQLLPIYYSSLEITLLHENKYGSI